MFKKHEGENVKIKQALIIKKEKKGGGEGGLFRRNIKNQEKYNYNFNKL